MREKEDMNNQQIFEKVSNIAKECVEITYEKPMTQNTDFVEDLKYDSVNLIQFIVQLEDEFDIVVGDEVLLDNKIRNLGEVVKFVCEQTKKREEE